MGDLNQSAEQVTHPLPEEIESARQFPGQWVYRIAGVFAEDQRIPPEAIVGAWKVNQSGQIEGSFQPNPNYDPVKYPS